MASRTKSLPPLFYAESQEEVRRLVSNGADVNQRGVNGHTVLHIVHNVTALREIIRLGGDVHARSNWQETPLHKQQSRSLNVSALIQAGADVNACDSDGDTPLHGSCSPGVTYLLLKAGADPNHKNLQGELPEDHYGDYLHSRAMTKMVKEVRARGALIRSSWKDYYVGRRKKSFTRKKG